MIVFDDCYLCNWLTSNGRAKNSRVSWCGAGRPEFNDDYAVEPCPTRSERIELSVEVPDDDAMLPIDIDLWLVETQPETKAAYPPYWSDGKYFVLLTFVSLKEAIFFKLNWCGGHTSII